MAIFQIQYETDNKKKTKNIEADTPKEVKDNFLKLYVGKLLEIREFVYKKVKIKTKDKYRRVTIKYSNDTSVNSIRLAVKDNLTNKQISDYVMKYLKVGGQKVKKVVIKSL